MKGIMKNNKGNIFTGVTIGLFLFIMGIIFLPFLVDVIDGTRTDLNCSVLSISDGIKINCLFNDLMIPYFIYFLLCLAIGYIVGSNR